MIDSKKYISYFCKENKDFFLEKSFINEYLYNKLKTANRNFNKLRKYIYENFFEELVKYEQIPILELENFILQEYKKHKFDDINLHNRGDFFITENGSIQIAEINHDTPFGFIESSYLNKDNIKGYINPNKKLMKNLVNALEKNKTVYIAGDISYPEELAIISFFKDYFLENNIKAYSGWFGQLEINGNGVFFGKEKIDTVIKMIPIDWLYEDFDLEIFEKLQENGKVKLFNNQLSYPFQLKSFYSFLWKNIELFEKEYQNIIKKHIPYSIRLDEVTDFEKYINNKNDWVLKHINIREGIGVFIGQDTDEKTWKKLIDKNKGSKDYILQKDFKTIFDENGITYNYGLYNIKNKFSGILFRMHKGRKTDNKSAVTGIYIIKNNKNAN